MTELLNIPNFVHGESIEPRGGAYLDNYEPAVGKPYAQVADSDAADVDIAVDAAAAAFPVWATMPAGARSHYLRRIADLIDDNLERLAQAESQDTGKPITMARKVDIPRAAANFRFFATAILHTESQSHATDQPVQAFNYTLRQPLGVVGCISPWNLPLYLFTWKIAPALATGNTVVGKPSELTPMTAHMLAELAREAELPRGVLNIVHGVGSKVGSAIVRHPRVPAITFTGGTVTGAAIARDAGPMFKKLALELGGKNPNIVFADCDFDEALSGSVRAAFSNQGQICLCGSRIFVERSIYDRFLEAFIEQTKQLKLGDPRENETQFGAMISMAHMQKVLGYIDLAKREGGTIQLGGCAAEPPNERCKDGYFIQPTVMTGLSFDCRTNQEEIFGPVVTIAPFDDEDQAIAWANSTPYGLAASVWSNHLARAHRVAERLQSGTVWVNCWLVRDLRVPFGGMKHSGVGREGGNEALRFFTDPKNVCIKLDTSR